MTKPTARDVIRDLLDRGETQLSIEAGSGVSQATISRILNGKAEDIRASTVDKLNDYAGRVRRRRKTATA